MRFLIIYRFVNCLNKEVFNKLLSILEQLLQWLPSNDNSAGGADSVGSNEIAAG